MNFLVRMIGDFLGVPEMSGGLAGAPRRGLQAAADSRLQTRKSTKYTMQSSGNQTLDSKLWAIVYRVLIG